VKELSEAINTGAKDAPVYKSGRLGHIGSPKDLRSVHIGFLAKSEAQEPSKPELRKVDDEPMTVFEATFEITQADKEAVVKDPANFVRRFLESHGQKVNDVLISTSFVREMSEEIKKVTNDAPAAHPRWRLVHLDGRYWSRFLILRPKR